MKTAFAIVLLLLVVAPAFTMRHGVSNASLAQLKQLKNNRGTWASFLVNLAEVHLTTGGPLDELVDAIEEVVSDLENKLDRAHADFDARTEQHNSEVARIQDLIDSAAADIASTTEYLQVLETQRQSFVSEIANLEQAIETNQQQTEEAIALRERQHQEFLVKVPEHQEAIAALDEALEVLSQLGDTTPSFAQVKKLQKNVEFLNSKLKRGQDKAFIKALMDIAADAQFADQGAIKRVANIMHEVRNNLTASLAQFQEEEAQQVAEHQQDLENKAAELARLQLELATAQENLAVTEQRIVDNEEFLAQREADKAESEQDLQDEHDSYQHDTEVYEDLVAQFNNELSACEAALSHLNSSEIADYIGGRMEQDVIIDQPHGEGITVETNPLDLE